MVPKSRKRKMRRCGGREEELRCAAVSPHASLGRRRGRRQGEVEASSSKRQTRASSARRRWEEASTASQRQ